MCRSQLTTILTPILEGSPQGFEPEVYKVSYDGLRSLLDMCAPVCAHTEMW